MAKVDWKPWWVFFPLKGFIITDTRHDLKSKPLFGDASILSVEHIKQIARSKGYKAIGPEPPSNFTVDKFAEVLTRLPRGGQATACLAVKCMANMADKEHKARAITHARHRAYRIASALCLITLARSSIPEGCGLYEQMKLETESYSALTLDDKRTGWVSGAAVKRALFDFSDWPISRADIQKAMNSYPTSWFANAVICRQPPLPRELEKVVTDATLRLAEAVYTSNPSSRVVNAVTSIEILISFSSDYDLLESRVSALLHSSISNYYKASEVFKARHNCVHKGMEITDKDVQLRAVGLALACLLRFAEIAPHFPHKQAIVDYLDWLRKADYVALNLSPPQRKAYNKVLKGEWKHKRGGAPFSWVSPP